MKRAAGSRWAVRAVAALAAASLVAACGNDDDGGEVRSTTDDGSGSASASGSGSGSAPGSATGPGAAGAGGAGPCGVDVAGAEAALGDTLGDGEASTTQVTEDDGVELSWTADECEWHTAGGTEVQLRTVAADALPESGCPPLSSPVYEISDVPDLGDSAQWEWDGMEGEGAVRACVAAGMAEARIESPDGAPIAEETVKAAAVALVEPALAAL